MDIDDFRRLEARMQRPLVETIVQGRRVWPLTADRTCAFLTREGRCVIHEDPGRPEICGRTGEAPGYACPTLMPDGTLRPEESKQKILAKIERDMALLEETIRINRFKCPPNCGRCCFTASFRPDFMERFIHKVQRKIIQSVRDGNELWLITEDEKCCFLSRENQCAIYENRPRMCVRFGLFEDLACPYLHTDGTPRTPRERDRIIDQDEKGKEAIRNRIRILQTRG
jgi:Fe-S-cluster containining protein